jgi:hypothetical protein
VVLLGLGLILRSDSPLKDRTADKISMVATTLNLTEPGDFVMDSKGETIYRNRPFYYVLEGLTGRRMKSGLIADTIPQRLIETGTPLATVRRMPRGAADFIRKNYILTHLLRFRRMPGQIRIRPSNLRNGRFSLIFAPRR